MSAAPRGTRALRAGLALGALVLADSVRATALNWAQLPSLPEPLGVAAPFAEVTGEASLPT